MELISFKVNLGPSAWNGLVAEGALKPKEKEIKNCCASFVPLFDTENENAPCWDHNYLIKTGLWSWLMHLLESSCPGQPKKLLQDPETPQVCGIYAGCGQPDCPRGVTGQRVQGCSHFGRFHSPDLHPWLHRTNPHLAVLKVNQVFPSKGCKKSKVLCLPVGLPVRGERSDNTENGSTAMEAANTPKSG